MTKVEQREQELQEHRDSCQQCREHRFYDLCPEGEAIKDDYDFACENAEEDERELKAR
jgi:hypothetical protein